MFSSKKWRFGTSLLLTLGMTLATATPSLVSTPAMAQYNPQRRYNPQRPYNQQAPYNQPRPYNQQAPYNQPRPYNQQGPYNQQNSYPVARVPAGTLIPVEYEEAEKIILTPDESMSLELTVTREIRDVQGRVVIPSGSRIFGELQPVSEGTQFFARQMVIDGRTRFPIDAISGVVTETETIHKGANAGDILKGAAIGAAAATLLSGIIGDKAIATEEVLGGAGLGALAGVLLGREKAEVVVIRPEEDLDLRLRSDILVR